MKIQVPLFNSIRVLVIGDLMLDRYWSGVTSRLSPEAPVPIVHVKTMEDRPGGAGNVALNIAAFGAQVDLLGFCGEDEAGDRLEEKLHHAGVNCYLRRMRQSPTTTKLRVLSLHQQLIRLDFEETSYPIDYQFIKDRFEERLPQVDVIILSDYAKGCLAQAQDLIQMARRANKPVFVDPKRSDFSLYQGATVLTPNRREFEAVVGVCGDEQALLQKGATLLKTHNFKALLITRGEQGMTLIQPDQPEVYFPAFAKQVYDVTGAGDTTIACLALVYFAKGDLVRAAQLANVAASIVVGKLGTAAVSSVELRRAIQVQQLSSHHCILTEAELQIAVEDARVQGERIVMTGGCFDILHVGHVTYLERAKQLGDRLIVAVNDDDSVTRLKGSKRPINTLEKRMGVLAGLGAVDWVVPFSGKTPESLIRLILPDVWVKGGDYRGLPHPEADVVKGYGGQVKLIDFLKGYSTSAIIQTIHEEAK